jgi:HD-GYP domain-containing protein (c-di-GMP phosphodiesterase class II)
MPFDLIHRMPFLEDRSVRPYRPAWTEEKTKEYIRSLSGIQFDPKVVDVFKSYNIPVPF